MKSTHRIISMKSREKISVLTCYDYCTAKILDEAGIDILLVGDSLGMVVLGYKSTREVTMQDMIRHTKAVSNGTKKSFIVGDMPYNSDMTPEFALKNAKSLISAGADAVKIEGKPEIAAYLVKNQINVMGHVGLLPQTAESFSIHGKDKKSAIEISDMSHALEKAGCFAIVIESIPAELARQITEKLKIPTIGIGAGKFCDGQVLVINDMLGLYPDFKPKFVRQYADLSSEIKKAVKKYSKEIKNGEFPEQLII